MMIASTGEVSISQKTRRYQTISPWENGFGVGVARGAGMWSIVALICILVVICILIVFRSDAIERESH
jgi:hypothetical protein